MTENEDSALEVSIVVPCYNEEFALEGTVRTLQRIFSGREPFEIVVVNDGSTDGTGDVLRRLEQENENLVAVEHESNQGYGAALKTGISRARAGTIAMVDADDSYPVEKLTELVDQCSDSDADMVVGARTGDNVTYSSVRALPKYFLTRWVSWLAKRPVPDINSGMRVFKRTLFERFMGILPDGFSFTITITLAALTNYYRVEFVPIDYHPRVGASKIRPIADTLRFLLIVLRTGTYFAPVRVFGPVLLLLLAAALASTIYDIFVIRDLTDKTVLLFLFAFNVAMFTLIVDMIDKRSK